MQKKYQIDKLYEFGFKGDNTLKAFPAIKHEAKIFKYIIFLVQALIKL